MTSSKIPKLIKQTLAKYAWEECSNISVHGEYNVQEHELSSIIAGPSMIIRDPLDFSTSLEPQVTDASIPRKIPRISKAIDILTHVILLADIQKVIEAQRHFLFKMKTIINNEFEKKQVGHVTFQAQSHVEHMISSFQDKIIKKVDELGGDNVSPKGSSSCTNRKNVFGDTGHEGR